MAEPESLEADPRWRRALEVDADGQAISAELLYAALLREHPGAPALVRRLARLANLRGDGSRAVALLQGCRRGGPDDVNVALELAQSLAAAGQPAQAERELETLVAAAPDQAIGWLLLGRFREARGDAGAALKAWYQAVTRAQRAGRWPDQASTPPQWLELVVRAIDRVAARQLIETISGLHVSATPRRAGERGGGVMQE